MEQEKNGGKTLKARVYIGAEELERQKEYEKRIRELNVGRQPLAYMLTYGCQQNESDTEKLRGMAQEAGYGFATSPQEADLILFNTCAVRENAEMRVFGNLGALKHLKHKRPEIVICVCGCMMQQKHIADDIRKKYRHVDMVFGTHALYKFPELLYKVLSTRERVVSIEGSDGKIAEDIPVKRESSITAQVSIMYGCNNFCSYCIVPYVRGRERSRKPENILAEVKQLAAEGYLEIMLLGQNVNSYGKDLDADFDFSDILSEICKLDGIERIRFMTSHPKDLSDKLIETIKNNKKICRQLHLPFQSGNDKILKLMNRRYTKQQYLELVGRIKHEIPDIALTTDVIVGFPTETREQFQDTLDVLRRVRYDMVFSFIYSKRKGTPAAEMEDPIPEEVKKANFNDLLRVQDEISHEISMTYQDKVVRVLVEGPSKTDSTVLAGRTDTGKIVNFRGSPELIGGFQNIKITEPKTWSLFGEIYCE